MSVSATASAAFVRGAMIDAATAISAGYGEGGRIELGGGKGHMAEELARVAFFCRHAFLIGHGIFRGVDEILRRTNDANDRKDADGYRKIAATLAGIAQRSLNARGDMRGNITATTATAALGGSFKDLGTKYDGIHHLHNRNWCVRHAATELRCTAKVVVGRALEHADIALTAKENDLLFQYCDAFEFLNAPGADTSLEAELDIEFDVDGIKAAIEGDGIDVDLRPGDAGALDTNVGCVLHNVIAKIGQKHTDMLKAIPIPTRVENTIGFDTDHVSAGRGSARKFVFCHKREPPCKNETLTSNVFL